MSGLVTTAVTPPEGVTILEQAGKFHINLAPNASYICTREEALSLYHRLGDVLVATNPELQP